jgi:protoporphyrinogen oxidase
MPPPPQAAPGAAPVPRPVDPVRPGDRVVCIGGGPAGLTAAYLLAKRGGVRVTVLEGTKMLGGISQTAQYKGYRFDIGGHRFFTKYEPVEALWHEILGPEFIQVPRQSRIHYRGKYFDYPLKAWNALSGLGLIEAVRCVYSYLHAKARPSPVEENFEQWVSNRFGKRLYNIFFKTYTEKVWGIPCTEIRAEWAAQRIQNLSLAKAILNAAAINRRSNAIKSLIDRFQYPRLGPGQMWEMCAEKITALGGQVLMEHQVEARARGRPRGRRAGAHAAGRGAHRGRALHLHHAGANSLVRPRARRSRRRCGARPTACATATSWWWR